MNEELRIIIRADTAEAERALIEFKRNYVDKISETDLLSQFNSQTSMLNASTLENLLSLDLAGLTPEQRKEALDNIVSEFETAYDSITGMQELYTASLEATQEAFDKQTEAYENINSVLESNLSLSQSIYGEKAFARMETFYKKMIANNKSALEMQKNQLEYWTDAKDSLDEELASLSGQERIDFMNSEKYIQINENYVASVESYYSSLETSLSTLRDDYMNSINKVFEDTSLNLTGGKGLDYISEEWGLIQKSSSKYLDDVNSAYQISKLEYTMDQSIDQYSGNIKAQERLNKLKEQELAALREKDKLTEQDLKRANMAYDLELKKIALEEAKNSASQMKLTRDANGNYSYSYVEDTDNIAKLQQEVADAENALYNFDKDRSTKMYEEALSAFQEYQQKMTAAADNPELQDLYNKQYFGEDGILTNLKSEITSLGELRLDSSSSGLAEFVNNLVEAQGLGSELATQLSDLGTEYKTEVDSITSEIESTYDEIAEKTESIVTNSEEFTTAMETQTTAIANALNSLASVFEKFEGFAVEIANKLGLSINENSITPETSETPAGFDTGGYTGAWGSSGKLAMLHEKELVLNQHDTENILAATTLAGSLDKVFEEISRILTRTDEDYLKDLNNMRNQAQINKESMSVDQKVQIDATFPNVVNSEEIQEAFDNLINLAVQRAYEEE